METTMFQNCGNVGQSMYPPSTKLQESSPPPQVVPQDTEKTDTEDTELANMFKQKITLSPSESPTLQSPISNDPKVIQVMDRPPEGTAQLLSGTASGPSQASGAYQGTRSRIGTKTLLDRLETANQGATPKRAAKRQSDKGMDYFYAFVLPFDYSRSPLHRVIKVGHSDVPGQRLYKFGNAFDKQTLSYRNEFKCNFGIKHGDSAVETIRKARECPKFLFIVACRGSEDWKRGEDSLRGLLGQSIVNDFISKLLKSVPDPDSLTSNCALTEWVTCTASNVEEARRAFMSNELNGNTGGDVKYWDSWLSLVEKLMTILPDTTTATFKVKFEHTRGTFEEDIMCCSS